MIASSCQLCICELVPLSNVIVRLCISVISLCESWHAVPTFTADIRMQRCMGELQVSILGFRPVFQICAETTCSQAKDDCVNAKTINDNSFELHYDCDCNRNAIAHTSCSWSKLLQCVHSFTFFFCHLHLYLFITSTYWYAILVCNLDLACIHSC